MQRLTQWILDLQLTVRALRHLVIEVRWLIMAVALLLITLTAVMSYLRHIL